MLHWPDTMFTYMDKEEILFSNDGFGQHLASEYLYADEVDQADLFNQALTYYANILASFGMMVKNKINEIHGNLLFPRERHHDAKSVIIVCLKLAVMD